MVTRRIVEMVIIVGVLMVPIKGSARLWAKRTMANTPDGSVMNRVAEVVSIVT